MTHKLVKPIGVLGGMGPLATKVFFGMIIDNTVAGCDQEHIDMIILNHAGTPDRTTALLTGETAPLFESLLADCVFLEESGATHIAIPCNTSLAFFDELQANLGIPIINMICQAVADVVSAKGKGQKVGILATDGTVRLSLYQKEMERQGLIPYAPSEENQRRVMKIIYEGIKGGGEIDFADFEEIQKELIAEGCGCAVMGCTELSCFMQMYGLSDNYYFDAMKSLAISTIIAGGGRVKVK